MFKKKEIVYDAIVVGTGISGGWAAKELCQNGLKTLVLDRGRLVNHILDYPTANQEIWDFNNLGTPNPIQVRKQRIQHKYKGATHEAVRHFFVQDFLHRYNEHKPYDWIRGYQVGGRSFVWSRQSYRMSDLDFEANIKDGVGIDWPIRYKDIEPWYDYVEKFIGVSGEKMGLSQLPDGNFLPPMELNCVENYFKDSIKNNFNRPMTIGRVANITSDTIKSGMRSRCEYRNRCARGCPIGGYFSSVSSTLPSADITGNMTIKSDSIVSRIIYDTNKKKATGVEVIDAITRDRKIYKSRIIFLCASTIASTGILLYSKSSRFPTGMGNDSGELGHNLMDVQTNMGARANIDEFNDQYYQGNRPNCGYIPRFQNLESANNEEYIRGYSYDCKGRRGFWDNKLRSAAYGSNFKDLLLTPMGWQIELKAYGEVLPYHSNMISLNYTSLDSWGLPTITFNAELKENEKAMRKDAITMAKEMLMLANFSGVKELNDRYVLGLSGCEMGTARMGKNPKTSVLNAYNQIHAVPNVFVTDGSAMVSSSCNRPALTYMALTARAVNYAFEQMRKLNI